MGVSAIEDKLQDGVPAAIQTLLDAGIKVACTHYLGNAVGFLGKAIYRCHVARRFKFRRMQKMLMPFRAGSVAHIILHCRVRSSAHFWGIF